MPLLYEEITNIILSACFDVINELGAGFLESVIQKSLLIALHQKSLKAIPEVPIGVSFRGQSVGQFYADILVENKVMVELKAVSVLLPEHKAQMINYLKASDIEVGLLSNFDNSKLEYRRLHK